MNKKPESVLSNQVDIDLPLNKLCNQLVAEVNQHNGVFADADGLPPGVYLSRKGNNLSLKGRPIKTGFYVCLINVHGVYPTAGNYQIILAIIVE